MTVPLIGADFGRFLNPEPPVDVWSHLDRNGRRRSGPLGLAGPTRTGALGTPPVWHVLFVSGAGVARSWMAAAMLAHYAGHHVLAGYDGPAGAVLPPLVVDVMEEIGLAPREDPPPARTLPRPPDLLITMGLTGVVTPRRRTRVRRWNVPDPEGQPIEAVRAVRDAIAYRVRLLVVELAAAS